MQVVVEHNRSINFDLGMLGKAQISCWWSDNTCNERKKKKKRKGREKKEGKKREKEIGGAPTAIFAFCAVGPPWALSVAVAACSRPF